MTGTIASLPALAIPKPKVRRRLRKLDAAMRRRIETAIDQMIDALDALDAPQEDLEDDDPGGTREKGSGLEEDDEPSLGSTEAFSHVTAWKVSSIQVAYGYCDGELTLGRRDAFWNQTFRPAAFGSLVDQIEAEHDGCEPDCDDEDGGDDEPSLGSSEPIEPPLGARVEWLGQVYRVTAEDRAAVWDQTRWACGDRDLEQDDADVTD
jgi:hypothetical protein